MHVYGPILLQHKHILDKTGPYSKENYTAEIN